MRGFWNNAEATAECIVDVRVRRRHRSPRCQRYLYRLDRACRAVEVAAFGTPDERWSEQVAVVCVKAQASVTEKELVELCSVHLGNYKRPGKVVLRSDPLPKTPIGKIKRRELREPF